VANKDACLLACCNDTFTDVLTPLLAKNI